MTGTVTKHKLKGGRTKWGYIFDAGGANDEKRLQIRRRGFLTKREAEEALRKALNEAENKPGASDPRTFSEFFDAWIREHCQRHCEATTTEGYIQKGEYAKRHFGDVPIVQLTAFQIEHALNTLRERGGKNGRPLSAKTVREIAAVVSSTLHTAIRWGVLDFNPMQRVTLPRAQKKEPVALEQSQLEWFFSAVAGHPWLELLFALKAATGCRRGELLALTWLDVDYEITPAWISISKSLAQTRAKGVFLKVPKGRKARRFSLPASAVQALRRHRLQQDEIRALLGSDYRNDLNLIFATPTGEYLKPDSVSAKVSFLARQLGFPKGISLHTLRHTHGSQLLSEGVPLPAVSKRLGHANTHITATVYAHALDRDDDLAAEAWERLMGQSMQPRNHKPN